MFKISEHPENHCITDYTKAQKNRSSIQRNGFLMIA